jgi:hypothetical protein
MFIAPFVTPVVSPIPVSPYPSVGHKAVEQQQQLPPSDGSGQYRYVNYIADYGGCGFWRILWPEMVLNMKGKAFSTSLTAMVFDPSWYQNVKCVKLQRQVSQSQ